VERAALALSDVARTGEARPHGRVRIALTEGLAQYAVVPRVLPALLHDHPDLSIDLVTGDGAVDLGRHEADIALRFFRTPRGELVGQRVARLTLAPLVARTHLRRFRGLSVRELPWIGYVREGIRMPESEWLEAIGIARPRIVCTSAETQLAAVRAGLGVAIGPRAQTLVHPDLCLLDGLELPSRPTLDLYVVTRAAIRRVPRIAVVYDALVRVLRELDG
jgi:DNA-binding transcriptional LysR family regulator